MSLCPIMQAYESSLRRRALIILHSCISTLGVMSGAYQQQTKELMTPMLKAWMEQFALILTPVVPSEDADDWGLRMEVCVSVQLLKFCRSYFVFCSDY